MTHDPVAIGVIGAGIMGHRLMAAALSHPDGTIRLAGAWDPAAAAMARLEAEHPTVTPFSDPTALISASDCVYIASPPSSHLAYARAAIDASRTVFCEKPLAVDLHDARDFVALAGTSGAVNFPFASSLAVEALRGWLADDVVGTPRSLAIEVGFARWPRLFQRDAAGWLDGPAEGGFTREVVSHFLFLSRRLLGQLSVVEARATFPETGRSERSIDVALRAGNVPVRIVGRVGPTDLDEHNAWTLEGDKGAIRLRDWALAEKRGADGRFQLAPDALPIELARPLVLRRQLDGVARLTWGKPHHLATLQEALDVQEVVEAILAS